jgi:MFS family permease
MGASLSPCSSNVHRLFARGNLAVAAPLLSTELHLSPWSLGVLLSGFFWTYAISQIGAGWLVDRAGVRIVYAGAFLLWSVATLASAFMVTFAGLFAMRLLLGLGESVAYPATSHVLAEAFPEERRGLANSVIDLGARIGPAAGTFSGALIMAHAGWRPLFFLTGLGALIWLIPWMMVAPRTHTVPTELQRTKVRWGELLTRPAVWGTTGGLCGANYAWYFILSWLPTYLVHFRHLSLGSMAIWGSIPYLLMAASSLGGGLLADFLISKAGQPVLIRKCFLAFGLAATALLLPTILLPQLGLALAGLLATCFAFGVYASNLYSLTQSLSGPDAAGRWTGLQNACGNLAGLASSVLTGWLINETGTYTIAFLCASAACIIGAASFWIGVREKGYAFVREL